MDTLEEWSDGDDEWVFDVDENSLWDWSDSEADEIIRNIQESDQTPRGEKRKNNEWSDSGDDEIIRGIQESDQVGRGGKKRKSDDSLIPEDFYEKESVTKTKSKKFRMSATDHRIRFNNVVSQLDLIESYQRTQAIIQYLLNDVTQDMNEKDQVRFVLRSEQLDTPISMPFMSVEQLTPEKVFSQIERVIQSNRDFRLNDTVVVDIIHVEAPQGSGRSKRNVLNIKDFLHKKRSVITIRNNDNLCLARALVVAIAKIGKDPNYKNLLKPGYKILERKARELHEAANVPLGPCGIHEVELFQKYLTNYEINIVSGNHDNSIIYPSRPSPDNNVTPIYLYLHDNHYDIITSMPGFLSDQYFCHKCRRSYTHKLRHLCPGMCKSCRAYDCVVNDPLECNECNRWFKSKACYD